MNAKHTPAPWKTRKGFGHGEIDVFHPDRSIKKPCIPTELAIVQINDDTKESIAESRANARLIAAAPDLLECLIHLADRDWFASGMTGEVVCGLDAEKVRNALSKALGQNAPVHPVCREGQPDTPSTL